MLPFKTAWHSEKRFRVKKGMQSYPTECSWKHRDCLEKNRGNLEFPSNIWRTIYYAENESSLFWSLFWQNTRNFQRVRAIPRKSGLTASRELKQHPAQAKWPLGSWDGWSFSLVPMLKLNESTKPIQSGEFQEDSELFEDTVRQSHPN